MNKELSLVIQTANGSIENYISSVNNIPMLSLEEEKNLSLKLKINNDLEAAKKLILSHLRVVVTIAKSYSGYGLNQADLIQEGNIGLMKAVKKFDPDRGVRLFSFAIHWIKAEIHEFILKNWRLVKIATTKAQRKLFFNIRSLKSSMNTLTNSEAQEIANKLGVRLKDVLEMEKRITGKDYPLITENNNNEEENFSPINWLYDDKFDPIKQLYKKHDIYLQTKGLNKALEQLDERSKDIVSSRWLSEDNNLTLSDLASKYKVSPERIRQIEAKAMEKMKNYLSKSI